MMESRPDRADLLPVYQPGGVRGGWAALLVLIGVLGCDRGPDSFPVNRVFARNQKLARTLDEFDTPRVTVLLEDIDRVATRYFGVPGDPLVPSCEGVELGPLFSLADLRRAAGFVEPEAGHVGPGLYRDLCVRCHGTSGDGGGRLARGLNPYPRDYRRGVFKFKRTPSTLPPTDADLHGVLLRGIPETAMPSFRDVPPSQRGALVQYVRYLSIRGLFERAVMMEVAITFDDDDRLLDPKQQELSPTAYARQVEMLDAILSEVVQPWLDVDEQVTDVPPVPADYDAPQ
mgnify:FL=1